MGKMSDLHIEISEFYGEEQPSQEQIREYMAKYYKRKRYENYKRKRYEMSEELEKLLQEIYADPDFLHEVVVNYAMEQLRS